MTQLPWPSKIRLSSAIRNPKSHLWVTGKILPSYSSNTMKIPDVRNGHVSKPHNTTNLIAAVCSRPLIVIRMSWWHHRYLESPNSNRVFCLREDASFVTRRLMKCKWANNKTYLFRPTPILQGRDSAVDQPCSATIFCGLKIKKHNEHSKTVVQRTGENLKLIRSLFRTKTARKL